MPRLAQPPRLDLRWQASVGDHVNGLAWAPDGQTVAAASVSGPISLFDVPMGAVRATLPGHGFGTAAISWHPNGSILASAGQDGKVRLWDPASGAEKAALDAGASWVERVAWGPRGDYLVSAAGKKLRLWDAAGKLVRAYPDQPSSVADVRWGPKGREFAAGGYGGVTVWVPDADAPKNTFEWRGSVLVLAWSPDGKYIASGNQDSSVHFWFTKSGQDLEMSGYPLKVREIAWDAGGRFLATGGGPLVTVWDCSGKGPAGTEPMSLEAHPESVSALAFQNRGPLLASGGAEGKVVLWQPGHVKRALVEAQLDGGVSQLAWSPTDGRLAVGCETGTVAVFGV